MVSFQAAVTATTTALVALLASASFTESSNGIIYERIEGYDPRSLVTDQNALDLDQMLLESQLLGRLNKDTFDAAFQIYSNGGNSGSIAEVTLANPLPIAVSKGTPISGVGTDGNQVLGNALEDTDVGAATLRVQYRVSASQEAYVNCQVGANPVPNTLGCLAESGPLDIEGTPVEYTYNVLENNTNRRTLQGLSTEAKEKMWDCPHCPYETYGIFVDYYGAYDYGNQWITAGFEGSETNFQNFNNIMGVESFGFRGRKQIITRGTIYLNVWMYVIRQMEHALDDCIPGKESPVHAWDEAVAFYTGSLEGLGLGMGKFLYALADGLCGDFKTCGELADRTTGTSWINIVVFENFRQGQAEIAGGECASARATKKAIESLMVVPLIQSTLQYAWKLDNEAYSDILEANGVISYASVAPMIHNCYPETAQIIADSMVTRASMTDAQVGSPKFDIVKAALESVYDCLGVDGAMVGGLVDPSTGLYFPGAEPFGRSSCSNCRHPRYLSSLLYLVSFCSCLFVFHKAKFLMPTCTRYQQIITKEDEEERNTTPEELEVEPDAIDLGYVELDVYSIDYFLPNNEIPMPSDYLELVQAIAAYFKRYMQVFYRVSTQERFVDFVTRSVSNTVMYVFG